MSAYARTIAEAQAILNVLDKFSREVRTAFNPKSGKCVAIIFRGANTKIPSNHILALAGCKLQIVKSHLYLSVIIANDRSWNLTIDRQHSRANQNAGGL